MSIPIQKTFGEFIKARFGPKWVYAARRSPRLAAKYPDSVVITPKQQAQLRRDYAAQWGREYDPPYWQMLCALREARDALIAGHLPGNTETGDRTLEAIQYAIERATTVV